MDAVKSFNDELSSIYESKPPISRAKMTLLTKKAIKAIKFYKHIVQSIEKFIQKCRPEYKVPGLYVIDSVVRQSRHQFGPEKDVFMPRLCKNIVSTFQHIYKCPAEDKHKIGRVLTLWQKNQVFPMDMIQQLLSMGGTGEESSVSKPKAPAVDAEKTSEGDASGLTAILTQLLANPDSQQLQQLAGLLSSSQQAQLQELIEQNTSQPQDNSIASSSVFQQQHVPDTMPFLHNSQPQAPKEKDTMFNRDVLDYDYSDDDATPRDKPHSKPIDETLLAKLPTVDQLQQLKFDGDDRMQQLKREQENFDKEIQQLSDGRPRPGNDVPATAYSNRREMSPRQGRHRHRRSRSRERDRHGYRSRSRERKRSRRSPSPERRRGPGNDHHERQRKTGLPPIKRGCISLCSLTIWIGNVASKVTQHELQKEVEMFGPVESINMIPPRGCAYICMKTREDATRALHKLKHIRLMGKSLKVDWAQGKEVKPEYKECWNKEDGCNYIPLEQAPPHLRELKIMGFVDLDTVPENRRDELVEEPPAAQPDLAKPGEMMIQPPTLMPNMIPHNPQMPMMVRPMMPYGQLPPGFGQPPRPTIPQGQEGGPEHPKEGAVLPGQPTLAQHPASIAQPFPQVGQMPVQIRMIPGPGFGQPQMMPQRMMPIRMGMPMQFRHRLPQPGMPRMLGPQIMGAFPTQQPMLRLQQPEQQVRPESPMRPEAPRPMDQPMREREKTPPPREAGRRMDGPPPMRERDEGRMRDGMQNESPMRPDRERERMLPDRRYGERMAPDMRGPPRDRMRDREREDRSRGMRERDSRGMGRDDRRRDDRGPPPHRERGSRWGPPHDRDRRDRDDMRHDDRRGRSRFDRGRDEDRFPPRRDDRGDRGRGRGGFRGGRGAPPGRGGWQRENSMEDEERMREEMEYRKKREETLKKRHEDEEEYEVEEIDMSAFGLPAGFASSKPVKEDEIDIAANDHKSEENRKSRKEWLESQGGRDSRDRRENDRHGRHEDRRDERRRRSHDDERSRTPTDDKEEKSEQMESQAQPENTETETTESHHQPDQQTENQPDQPSENQTLANEDIQTNDDNIEPAVEQSQADQPAIESTSKIDQGVQLDEPDQNQVEPLSNQDNNFDNQSSAFEGQNTDYEGQNDHLEPDFEQNEGQNNENHEYISNENKQENCEVGMQQIHENGVDSNGSHAEDTTASIKSDEALPMEQENTDMINSKMDVDNPLSSEADQQATEQLM